MSVHHTNAGGDGQPLRLLLILLLPEAYGEGLLLRDALDTWEDFAVLLHAAGGFLSVGGRVELLDDHQVLAGVLTDVLESLVCPRSSERASNVVSRMSITRTMCVGVVSGQYQMSFRLPTTSCSVSILSWCVSPLWSCCHSSDRSS